MTGWLIVGGYVFATLLASRATLRWWMQRVVCASCGRKTSQLPTYCYLRANDFRQHGAQGWKPRGALRARQPRDAVWALLLAVGWPVILLVVLTRFVLWRHALRPALSLLLRTPLTMPEQERVLAEQAKRIEENNREIERLTREIEEPR